MPTQTCQTAPIEADEWIRMLGGECIAAGRYQCASLEVGHYRFPERPEQITAPPLTRHYLSITMEGPTQVERNLSGDFAKAHFAPGTSLIMSAGQPNTWRWNNPTEEIHLSLCPEFLRRMGESANIVDVELIDRFAFADSELRCLATALLSEVRSPGIATELWLESITNVLYMHVLRTYCRVSPSSEFHSTGLTAAQIRRVTEYVNDNINREITLAEMAEVAGVSRFHFAHMFKRTVGTPPHQWLIERRLERAKELLRTTRMTIADIAFEVGYQSQSHFGHIFRRATGMSPRRWRMSLI